MRFLYNKNGTHISELGFLTRYNVVPLLTPLPHSLDIINLSLSQCILTITSHSHILLRDLSLVLHKSLFGSASSTHQNLREVKEILPERYGSCSGSRYRIVFGHWPASAFHHLEVALYPLIVSFILNG